MNIEKISITESGINIPAIKMSCSDDSPNVIVIHGYGGNKEEQLGLSWRISNLGFNTFTIDLRGHGENPLPLSIKIQEDVDSLISGIKKYSRPIITIGHSLGGRLSLLSKADYRIGISPALSQSYSEQTKIMIKNLRQYRVIEDDPDINFEILEKLPLVTQELNGQDLIIYGSRDVPEIFRECEELSENYVNIVKVQKAIHGDIFLNEQTFLIIEKYLSKWSED